MIQDSVALSVVPYRSRPIRNVLLRGGKGVEGGRRKTSRGCKRSRFDRYADKISFNGANGSCNDTSIILIATFGPYEGKHSHLPSMYVYKLFFIR